MPENIENTQRIISYLKYLRDVSRKIVSRSGFEKCFLSKPYAGQFDDLLLSVTREHEFYKKLKEYLSVIENNPDKKLFLGFGAVTGTLKRTYAAPLIYIECEMSSTQDTGDIILEPDIGTVSLNYDLLSSLSNNLNQSEGEYDSSFSDEENEIINEYQEKLNKLESFDVCAMTILASEVFQKFAKTIDFFKPITHIIDDNYNFLSELRKFIERTSKNRKNNHDNMSIFEKSISFIDANHFFVNTVPDQLSTYEALNSFVQTIENDKEFQNPIVEKMLANALTNTRFDIRKDDVDEYIQKIIDTAVPISLSSSQIQAIKNAWAYEISYIQGPPGTGKSHTISAIVLSAVAMEKKVLVLSQKNAALKVVRDKIEPLLSDCGDMMGICYYEKADRNKIRTYCKYLSDNVTSFSSTLFSSRKTSITELEELLDKYINERDKEKMHLDTALTNLHEHNKANEEFLRVLKQFNEIYIEIPEKFEFTRINDMEKHEELLKRIYKITCMDDRTLASEFYKYKFKQHLCGKFNIPEDWIPDNDLYGFGKAFINLNYLFTTVKTAFSKIITRTDPMFIRKRIKQLDENIQEKQKELIKLKLYDNVFSKMEDIQCRNEIEHFRSMLFNTNSRIVNSKMQQIDFEKVLDVMPFWAAEIRNLGSLLPLKPDLFDLVVVDEASQVNLAEIIPAFYRGKRICIVGDHNQLSLKSSGLNFSLSNKFDEYTWEKYNKKCLTFASAVSRNLTVSRASILDFFRSEEYQVRIKEAMLDEHFRSLPHLSRYTSRQFYKDDDNPDGKLKIMTETPHNMTLNCFQVVRVNGERNIEASNKTIEAEADEVVKIIYDLVNQNNINRKYIKPESVTADDFTIGVISMIRDQCECIKDILREKFQNGELYQYGINPDNNEGVGTPEEFQGNERDIMIFTLCLDNESKAYGHFQDEKRLNVATSRARSFTYFVYSPFPKNFNKIYNYLNYIKGNVTSEDTTTDNSDNSSIKLPDLDHNKFESDFERYVCGYLEKYIEQNSGQYRITLHNQVTCCGQKRLDFVIHNHDTKKSVVIEVDGRHHFASGAQKKQYTVEHVERMEILTRAGWNIINTPYYKWYNNGWLAEDEAVFQEEIKRIYDEIDVHIQIQKHEL